MDYQYHYLALALDGDSSAESPRIVGFPLDGSAPFSISAWFRVGKNDRQRSIISQEGVFSLYLDENAVCFRFNEGSAVSSDPSQHMVCDEQWHHVCVSLLESFLYLYVDGVLCNMVSKTGRAAPRDLPFVFGEGIVGHIREVRIYKNPLYSDEVAKAMLDEPDTSRLLAWYDFSQNPPVEKCGSMPVTLRNKAYVAYIAPAGKFVSKRFAALSEENGFLGYLSQDYTVQLWVNFSPSDEKDRTYTLFSVCNDCRTVGARLYIENTGLLYTVRFRHGTDDIPENTVSYSGIRPGVWTNIAVVKKLNTLSLYVDGECAEGSMTDGVYPMVDDTRGKQLLYIGSDAFSVEPNGDDMFEGEISRFDLWSAALSAEEVREFSGDSPDPSDQRLVSSCDFTSPIPNNVAGMQPIYEMNGFGTDESEEAAGQGVKEPVPLLKEEREPLSAGQLSELRMKAAVGIQGNADSAGKGILAVNSLRSEGSVYFVFHNEQRSYTVASLTAEELRIQSRRLGMTEEEVIWWVELILMLIGGVLWLLLGVQIGRSSSIAAFVANRIVPLAAIRGMSLVEIGVDLFILFFKIFYKENLLLPLLKLVLQGIGFFALLRIAASLVRFAVGYYVVDLALLVIQIGNHIKNKPSPLTDLALETVLFNHGQGKVSPMNIRENERKSISAGEPEWKGAALYPVLYNIGNFKKGDSITIRCTFYSGQEDSGTAWVRARDVSDTALFGDSEEQKIRIDKKKSGFVMFRFPNHQLADKGILKEELRLEWEYSYDRNTWKKMGASNHLIYTILGTPGYPWGGEDVFVWSNEEECRNRPWISALDVMYPYVKGIKDLKSLYRKITETVNSEFGFKYDVKQGRPKYYSESDIFFYFYLAWCIKDMANHVEAIINCTDCAAIVTTFANLYGGQLSVRMIGSGFDCYKIQSIGSHDWAYTFQSSSKTGQGHFSMHQIAVEYTGKDQDNRTTEVYDSCLKVDDSPTPGEPHGNAVLPVGMRFSAQPEDATFDPNITPLPDNSYREHLVIRGEYGLAKCRKFKEVPRPLKSIY